MSTIKRSMSSVDDIGVPEPEPEPKRRAIGRHPDVKNLAYPPTSAVAKPAPFQRPSALLTFSYTPSRALEFNDSALRYYIDPPRGANLRYGYERWVKRPEEKGRLDGLLKALSSHLSRLGSTESEGWKWLNDIGVVSWRGVMTKILTAPYEDRDAWEMNVMEVNGTLYLEEHLSAARLAEKEDMTPNHRLQSYYGYSFESWCTSSMPRTQERLEGHPPGWSGDVDTNVQWCSVVKTKLADTRLIIGGEVDCVRGQFKGGTDNFVELKTSITIRGPQDEARFEKKLLKFYFQSFLLGVPEIVVGFRTPSGQLSTLQTFNTMEIPRLVRNKPGAWDPIRCLDWGSQFLSFLRSLTQAVSPLSAEQEHTRNDQEIEAAASAETGPRVWRVKFEPRVGISAWLLDEDGVHEVEAGEDRIGFLPRWYWDDLQRHGASFSERSGGEQEETAQPKLDVGELQIPPGWKI